MPNDERRMSFVLVVGHSEKIPMTIDSQIFTDVDYDQNGKQFGALGVPQSFNMSGWATVYVPICVIKNGVGPTALISGGNHGDEYEGQVALMNLARQIDPAQ